MKISIGSKFIEGPYGGGNLFVKNLQHYLIKNGHKVTYDLKDDDIDVILLINPLLDSEQSTYDNFDINFYQKYKNPNAISVQRINECDERKATNHVNKSIIKSNENIDYTIYVSNWIQEIFVKQGLEKINSSVILGGANKKHFNTENKKFWDGNYPIKLVTHHWSSNWMKGFDSYKEIDEILNSNIWKEKLEFTYIGNLPKDFKFKNVKTILPLEEKELGEELKKHDIYITGSINEPSGNHHIEAAQCGLPILYINSGGITEYCKNYGLEFSLENLEERLNFLINNYQEFKLKLRDYPLSSEKMSKDIEDLFKELVENKDDYIVKRKNQIFLIVMYNLILKKIKKLIFKIKIKVLN